MDRDVNLAYKGFEKMPEKNVVSWTLMITRFTYTIMLPIRGHKFWSCMAYGFEGVYIKWNFIDSLELELLSLGWPFHSPVTMMGLALDANGHVCKVQSYANFVFKKFRNV
jgi:hypothetical protein